MSVVAGYTVEDLENIWVPICSVDAVQHRKNDPKLNAKIGDHSSGRGSLHHHLNTWRLDRSAVRSPIPPSIYASHIGRAGLTT